MFRMYSHRHTRHTYSTFCIIYNTFVIWTLHYTSLTSMFSHALYQLSDSALDNVGPSEAALTARLEIPSALMRNHAH